jgi:transglutaminase-like putative cysteine protease
MFGVQSLRFTSGFTLFFFVWLTLQPLRALAEQTVTPTPPAASLEDALDDLRATAEKAESKAKRGQDDQPEKERLLKHLPKLDGLESEAEADFAGVEAHLKAHHLPEEIQARHRAAVAEFRVKMGELKRHLRELDQVHGKKDRANEQRALGDLTTFLKKAQKRKPHQPFDPKSLPFRTPDEKVRPAKEKKEELEPLLHSAKPVQVAATDLTPGLLAYQFPPALGLAPTPEDLTETEDVQISQAIKDQAAALHHNPVDIWNWVRNTVEFVPTYGSVQGSDLTLQTLRGNAFDTSSLLIALLRASGIPARYVYGTIQVPADQVMNWVGGVTTSEAAQNLLGQGGIPTTALVSGGKIVAFKLEHVWVSAFVDYIPSRGAVNRQGDTWVPLDGSFKQYTYTQGIDLKTAVPLDAQALVERIKTGATVNEVEGWVQNLNATDLQTTLTDYQTRLKTYIDSQNPNATVGDVLGTKAIVTHAYPILMGTLPYQTVATGTVAAALPDTLRAKYRYTLYTGLDYNPLGGDIQRGGEVFTHTINLPKLAGGKLTLSFVPATQADTDIISSYLPQPHTDGSPIQPSELPTSLPGYLIHLKAEYRIDGQLVASGGDFTMGSSYLGSSALYSPDRGWEEAADNVQTAGEYWATYVGVSVSQSKLNAVKAKLEGTMSKLEQFQADPANPIPVADLTKEDLSGDLLYGTILGYFAANESSQRIEQKAAQAIAYRKSGFGHFGLSAKVIYRWGIPRQVSFPGFIMDVDHWRDTAVIKDNNTQKRIAFVHQMGMRLSAYEHFAPEKFWANAQNPSEGISAVKVLAKAASEGQKIYTLTSSNASAVYQLQIDNTVQAEIQNALNTGKTATVHEKAITISGWTGTGYIIEDPATGAGAYKISGGANGGALADDYWARYLAWVCDHMITNQYLLTAAPLLTLGMKSWFGFGPLLGSKNPYTSVIHGLSVWLMQNMGVSILGAGFLGRYFWWIGFFIGIYNATILIEGLFYVRRELYWFMLANHSNRSRSYAINI